MSAVVVNARFSLLWKGVLGCLLLFSLISCSAPRGVWHNVEKGQTLYRISKTYQVSESHIASINRISDPTQLKVGTSLFIPGVTEVRDVPATVRHKPTPKSSGKTAKSIKPKPATPKTAAAKPKASKPQKPVVRKKTTSKTSSKAKKGMFTWPVKGKIVRRFGGKGENRCNGIEVAVSKGTAVHSSAAGKVIYSGNGIPGYGNLVILEHDDTYYTVYGFNQKNLVNAGSFVSRGEKIALSGVPPSGGRSRIYFEVRFAKTPVNPILYLP